MKNNVCGCLGSSGTLNMVGFTIDQPCSKHTVVKNNVLTYDIFPLLLCITKNDVIHFNGDILHKMPILILETVQQNHKTIIKVEIKHQPNQFSYDNWKHQIYYSAMNDEPLWKVIDNETLHLIFPYNAKYHYLEGEWSAYDY